MFWIQTSEQQPPRANRVPASTYCDFQAEMWVRITEPGLIRLVSWCCHYGPVHGRHTPRLAWTLLASSSSLNLVHRLPNWSCWESVWNRWPRGGCYLDEHHVCFRGIASKFLFFILPFLLRFLLCSCISAVHHLCSPLSGVHLKSSKFSAVNPPPLSWEHGDVYIPSESAFCCVLTEGAPPHGWPCCPSNNRNAFSCHKRFGIWSRQAVDVTLKSNESLFNKKKNGVWERVTGDAALMKII